VSATAVGRSFEIFADGYSGCYDYDPERRGFHLR